MQKVTLNSLCGQRVGERGLDFSRLDFFGSFYSKTIAVRQSKTLSFCYSKNAAPLALVGCSSPTSTAAAQNVKASNKHLKAFPFLA
ncbi:hypothetical protein [Pontibacter beigongshangensis]|uniref:hypothetical protein n=1 Tax=Pontibacter beigongshangensis TaxID=2574733 RepID=UPI0019D5E650|nr:hypothetical protein [Pontibacter beigongshangensis]